MNKSIEKTDYRKNLDKWAEGLFDEMLFWEDFMDNDGGPYDASLLENYLSNDGKFVLEKFLPDDPEKEFDFIDVGSGPFSTCGYLTQKVKLNFVAVDPLGEFYNIIKRRYACENGVNVLTGFIELLDKKFEANSFDLVHIRNALDHCYDPMFGIYQLMRLCRIGGTIVLRHFENEAEHENYMGMHQWNLSVGKDGKYKIWNREREYDLQQEIGEYGDVFVDETPVVSDSGDLEYEVVIKKTKDIDIPSNIYYEEFLWAVYSRLITTYMRVIDDNELVLKKESSRRSFEKLKVRISRRLLKIKHNHTGIVLYGLGRMGEYVIDECSRNSIEVIAIMDKQEKEYKGYKTQNPEKYIDKYNGEMVLVTVSDIGEAIKDTLIKYGFPKDRLVWLAE